MAPHHAKTMQSRLAALALATAAGLAPLQATAQAATPKTCAAADKWFQCAKKVKSTIKAAPDAKLALAAAAEWADRYDALYRVHERDTWTWNDQKLLELAIEKLYDEGLGNYLDPASIAFALALAKYLPRLAAAVEFAGSTYASGFLVLLAPSPVANEFTEAGPDNKEIEALVLSKLPPVGAATIQQRYPELFNKAFIEVQAGKRVVKP